MTRLFGWAVGPESFKQSVFPSSAVLWRARRDGEDVTVEPAVDDARPEAFFGARPCEVAALDVLGGVLAGASRPDPAVHADGADAAFVVAVECGRPAATCFCTSMGSGPGAASGFDLALTELAGRDHRFLVRVGSERGAAVLAGVASRPAGAEDLRARERGPRPRRRGDHADARRRRRARVCSPATSSTPAGRTSPPAASPAATARSCARPASAPPSRRRPTSPVPSSRPGAGIRASTSPTPTSTAAPSASPTRSRYRQWMTHKLSTWVDQFGNSGCVGCGRCITWCPVGIDITEELAAIAASDGATKTDEPTAVRDR